MNTRFLSGGLGWLLLLCYFVPRMVAAESSTTDSVRIAVYRDKGAGRSVTNLLAVLKKEPRFQVTEVTAAVIRDSGLGDFDLIIHPGGSGGGQGRNLGEAGRTRVRDFVREGGGYLGFCAGAYLASNDYDWSLNLIDARVLDRRHWARGHGDVVVDLTEAGRSLLGWEEASVNLLYWQGPLLAPKGDPEVPDYAELGVFKTEVHRQGVPGGVMPGTTAIASGQFGKGRVLAFSPHPERTPGLEAMVHRAVFWTTGREPRE